MIKLSFCFQLIPFLESSLLSVRITNVTSTNFWKNDHACQSFAPTVPKVGSRYSKFGLEKNKKNKKKKQKKKQTNKKKNKKKKKTNKTTAFGFEKNNNNNNKTTAELGFLGSISQTRRNCIYERWTTGAGCGEALRLFYGKHVLAILKTCSTRFNWGIIHECSRTFRNNAILSFDFIICQSEQFTMAIRLIFTHLIQMITDIHI